MSNENQKQTESEEKNSKSMNPASESSKQNTEKSSEESSKQNKEASTVSEDTTQKAKEETPGAISKADFIKAVIKEARKVSKILENKGQKKNKAKLVKAAPPIYDGANVYEGLFGKKNAEKRRSQCGSLIISKDTPQRFKEETMFASEEGLTALEFHLLNYPEYKQSIMDYIKDNTRSVIVGA